MSKFFYSSGLPGFGARGHDGSAGTTGLSMYFTNLNGETDQTSLRTKIINNYILWSTSTPLPNSREYQDGDLFIDSVGKVYVISSTYPYRYTTTNTNFTATSYFIYGDACSNFGMKRYSNTYTDYLIDNVLSQSTINYTANPTNIYSIQPKDFARIEYSDAVTATRNPFTLYIASDSCANKALAIVRDTEDNKFRIGNIDADGNARNVDVIFDVDKLMVSKDRGKVFTQTTDSGTVVTNYEINANSLFNPLFNYSPTSFTYDSSNTPTCIRVYWNKCDFLNSTDPAITSSVPATLYFMRKWPSYHAQTWDLSAGGVAVGDASVPHIILPSIDLSGYIDVSGLTEGHIYSAYIMFQDHGWVRTSVVKEMQTGVGPVLYVADPCTAATGGLITTDASGILTTVGATYFGENGFRLSASTNIASDITVEKDKTWLTLSTTTPSLITGQLIDACIASTTGSTTETATILIHSAAPDACIYVTRLGKPSPVSVYVDWDSTTTNNYDYHIEKEETYYIYADGMPPGTYVDISVYLSTVCHNYNSSQTVSYNNTATLYGAGSKTIANTIAATVVDLSTGLIEYDSLGEESFPLVLVVNVYADSTADVTNEYDTQLAVDDIKIKYRSGNNISISYGAVQTLTIANYPF